MNKLDDLPNDFESQLQNLCEEMDMALSEDDPDMTEEERNEQVADYLRSWADGLAAPKRNPWNHR